MFSFQDAIKTRLVLEAAVNSTNSHMLAYGSDAYSLIAYLKALRGKSHFLVDATADFLCSIHSSFGLPSCKVYRGEHKLCQRFCGNVSTGLLFAA